MDGTVSANGANALNDHAGGGSGGSIWLSAQTFVGVGKCLWPTAARVSLRWAAAAVVAASPFSMSASAFPGTLAAQGGSGYVRGGAGTIYTRATSQTTGQLLVDNGGKAGASTFLITAEALDLTVQGGAIIPLPSSQTSRQPADRLECVD